MLPRVDFCSYWDNPLVLEYNRYYLRGLSNVAELTSSTQPWYVAPLPSVDAKIRFSSVAMNRLFARLGRRYVTESQYYVGQYILDTGRQKIRVAIDPHDNRKIASKPILDWCDVYFKSNKWTAETYPSKVLPLINGNGVHNRRSLAFLKSLRHRAKAHDFLFVSRLGADLEHNIKVFQSLSRLKCRKVLIAVLYPEWGHDKHAATLESFGVTCVPRNLSPVDLWTLLASSRVNFIRLGMKFCVPWRMIDFLCMGSCLVIDRRPPSDWPVPLRNDENFVCCFEGKNVADRELDYSMVAHTVERVLDSPGLAETIGRNNAIYYDRFASPDIVAKDLLERALLHHAGADSQDLTFSDNVGPFPTDRVWINNA